MRRPAAAESKSGKNVRRILELKRLPVLSPIQRRPMSTPESIQALQVRIHQLETRSRRAWLMGGLALLLGIGIAARPAQNPDVLYARGLVIVDEEGRERILIGAPLPEAKHRIRTDMDKVKAAWGERFGGQLDWYENVRHDTVGMLVIDEKGYDRIAIGDPVPDPPNGRRIDNGPGIAINDGQGFERSGWSYFDERDQMGFGLDRASGEGINMFLLKDGTTGILLRNEDRSHQVFLGYAPAASPFTGFEKMLNGLLLLDDSGPRLLIDSTGSEPGLELHDQDGDLVESIWR